MAIFGSDRAQGPPGDPQGPEWARNGRKQPETDPEDRAASTHRVRCAYAMQTAVGQARGPRAPTGVFIPLALWRAQLSEGTAGHFRPEMLLLATTWVPCVVPLAPRVVPPSMGGGYAKCSARARTHNVAACTSGSTENAAPHRAAAIVNYQAGGGSWGLEVRSASLSTKWVLVYGLLRPQLVSH